MKQSSKKLGGIIIYAVTAILYIVTMAFSYKSVSENLDGWHGFKSGHAIVFIIICTIMVAGCIQNIASIWKNKINLRTHLTGVALIVLPLLFHIVSVGLIGNVETDLQYLMLRTFQGFDSTYLGLIVLSIIGYIVMLFVSGLRKSA